MKREGMTFGDIYLSTGELTCIVELLGALKTYEEVQDAFYSFCDKEKSVSKNVIQQVQLRFADKIKAQKQLYLENIEGCPLAHLKVRVDIAYKILQDSLKQRPAYIIKVGADKYETIYKADNITALRALQLVMQDLNKREELDLEQKKSQPIDPTGSTWEIAG